MTTTRASITVAINELADHLMRLLLRPREVILKNKLAKSRYVQQLRKDCRRLHAKPMHMICAIAYEDAEDPKIPIQDVVEPFEQLITLLKQRREEVETDGVDAPSLLPVMLREGRAEADLNDAQMRATANPYDLTALSTVLEKSAAYDEAQNRMTTAVRDRVATMKHQQSRGHQLATTG